VLAIRVLPAASWWPRRTFQAASWAEVIFSSSCSLAMRRAHLVGGKLFGVSFWPGLLPDAQLCLSEEKSAGAVDCA
jgi:hypothetical protein